MEVRVPNFAAWIVTLILVAGGLSGAADRGQLGLSIAIWCACGSLAIILLLIRDSRGRFSLQTLFLLMAFAGLLVWSVVLLIHMAETESSI
jgi:hypothetical protein